MIGESLVLASASPRRREIFDCLEVGKGVCRKTGMTGFESTDQFPGYVIVLKDFRVGCLFVGMLGKGS